MNPLNTKVIVTLGPSSSEKEVIERMIKEGASAIRINFSHGKETDWVKWIKLIREAEVEKGVEIPIIGDLSGPGIRTSNETQVELIEGQTVTISMDNSGEIPIKEPLFFSTLEPGDLVLIDDGKISLKAEKVRAGRAELKVVSGGKLQPSKSVVIKEKETPLPPLTEKDLKDVRFSAENDVDFLAMSFVRGSDSIEQLRGILRLLGSDIGILAKIETKSGVSRFEEIARVSDGVIIARGDLGMHYDLEEIPNLQRSLIEKARILKKPVIVATQFLETMRENPVPTRSEVMDVYSAVLSGVDGLMVTAETAIGKYPVECVRWISRIITRAEEELTTPKREKGKTLSERFSYGVVTLAESLGAKILIYTRGGNTPRRISSHRPLVPVYAGSPNPRTRRKVKLYWGVEPVLVPGKEYDYEKGLIKTMSSAKREGKIVRGDVVVLTYGIRGETTHTVRIERIVD